MNSKRIKEIMENKEVLDVYFQDNPVWVQELKENTAKVRLFRWKNTRCLY